MGEQTAQRQDDGAPVTHAAARPPMRWYQSLHFWVSASQLLVLLFVVSATIAVLVVVERALLLKQGYELAEQLGNRVVSELSERVALAEAVTVLIANYGETTTKPDDVMATVPRLLDYEGQAGFIAGGGVWPEPFAFDPQRERRSFFWGREPDGSLKYYDDYNDPAGAGYHHEEWYVPARYYAAGDGFWSKSYMDPYSYQPMVTCTVPMRRDGQFVGVATTDLKLEGLGAFFAEAAQVTGGYIFALDRNNKFLSFPEPDRVKRIERDAQGKQAEEYLDLETVADTMQTYLPLADQLRELNRELIAAARAEVKGVDWLASEIDDASYQISKREAELLAAQIKRPLSRSRGESLEVARVDLAQDPVLGAEAAALVFLMPQTHWKIVLVLPTSKFYGLADEVTLKVALFVLAIELTGLVIMFIVVRLLLIRPIDHMSRRLRAAGAGAGDGDDDLLDDSSPNELGTLAHEFNMRSSSLAKMHHDKLDAVRSLFDARKRQFEADRAADRARVESRAKSEFLAVMSHEIRTPMNGVLGMAELLSDTRLDVQQQRYVQSIRASGQALLRVINDILDYSKIDAGKLEIESVYFDLENLVDEIALIFSPAVSESGVQFMSMIEPGTCMQVRGDPTRVRQILVNLIGNAFKFTREGQITLRIFEAEQPAGDGLTLRFEVSDTGIGISSAQRERLFAPFSQADVSTTRQYGGSGLGLSICRKLAELMDGEAGVSSEEGAGSTFWFTIAVERWNLQESREKLEKEGKLRGHSVVIVGDNAFNPMFERLLQGWQMPTRQFAGANGADAALHAERADIVLVHQTINGGDDGLAYAQRLAEGAGDDGSAILLVVGSDFLERRDSLEFSDKIRILENPITVTLLRDVLADALGFRRRAHPRNGEPEPVSLRCDELGVLVVEDNKVNSMVIVGMLAKFGIKAELVANGQLAVERCAKQDFDLILMDCEMPVMDGYEATRRIRRAARRDKRPRPVIAGLSAHAIRDRVDQALEAGMDDYLTKPVSVADIEQLLSRYFAKRGDQPSD